MAPIWMEEKINSSDFYGVFVVSKRWAIWIESIPGFKAAITVSIHELVQ